MQKLKKILIYTGGGIGGLFALLIVASMFMGTSTLPGMDEDVRVTDQKLNALREREAELQDVYEGDDNAFFAPEQDDELYANVGELSDFDAPLEDASAEQAESLETPSSDEAGEMNGPFLDSDSASYDDALTEALNGTNPAGDNFYEIDSPNMVTGSNVGATNATAPSPANPNEQANILAELSTLEEHLNDELNQFESVLDQVKYELAEVSQQKRDSQQESTITQEIRDDLKQLRQTQSDIADETSATRRELTALSARIEALESARTSQQAQRQQPNATTLRNLYRLARIEGSTAVLIGQNTGREYVVGIGDTLVYSGRVSDIRGDRVTLRWPNVTTTLSVY